MMHHSILCKFLVLTLSLGRDIRQHNYSTDAHTPRIHAAVFAIPAISASVSAILEAIATTTAALLTAKTMRDWYRVDQLEQELEELEEQLKEAESEAEAALEED